MKTAALAISILGICIAVICHGWLAVVVARKRRKASAGWAAFFFPPIAWSFAFERWDRSEGPFMGFVFGVVLALIYPILAATYNW